MNEEITDSDIKLEEGTAAPTKHLKPRVGSHVIVAYEGELFRGRVDVLDVKGAEVNVIVNSGCTGSDRIKKMKYFIRGAK